MHLPLGTDKPDFVTQKNINHEWHDWNIVLSEWYHICGVGCHGRYRMVVGLATAYVSSVTKTVWVGIPLMAGCTPHNIMW
jgi:hypothetical protein